ncbi:hypothetical protein C2S52_020770 [Perilla frutescens var. hirtella]|nr:hypothetical protein C2S52_020770 [Perilla frutescens var. hirtella]KAH6805114.1 hypothetical protein C2S51_029945 [Perilla frutescens var. frutescens]
MAFRRSVAARAKFFYQQQQRVAVPLSHVDRHDNDDLRGQNYKVSDYLRRRLPGDNWGSFSGSRNLFGDRRFGIPAVFVRKMSSSGGEGWEVEMMNELGEKAIEAVGVPVANEVAAAEFGKFPVDACQYLIDHVHTFTGLNWWASIALCTILIRTLLLPCTIYHIKATTIFAHTRPQVVEIEEEIKSRDKSPLAGAVVQARIRKLYNQYGFTRTIPLASYVTALTPLPFYCFFFVAINNMAGKVESFKDGGAFWFTDLTTRDATIILPVLAAFAFWMALRCHADPRFAYGGRAVAAALTLPIAASAPKPEVKKMLGIPDVAEPPLSWDLLQVPPPSIDEWHPPLMIIMLYILGVEF